MYPVDLVKQKWVADTGSTKTPKQDRSAKRRGKKKLRVEQTRKQQKQRKKGLSNSESTTLLTQQWVKSLEVLMPKKVVGKQTKKRKAKMEELPECEIVEIGVSQEVLKPSDEVLKYLDSHGINDSLYVLDVQLKLCTDMRCTPLHRNYVREPFTRGLQVLGRGRCPGL